MKAFRLGKHEHVERKLAAILAADIVGYSRLMGDDFRSSSSDRATPSSLTRAKIRGPKTSAAILMCATSWSAVSAAAQ